MVTTREFLVMARHSLIPGWFAYVNAWTGTPLRIVIPFGIAKGASPPPSHEVSIFTALYQMAHLLPRQLYMHRHDVTLATSETTYELTEPPCPVNCQSHFFYSSLVL